MRALASVPNLEIIKVWGHNNGILKKLGELTLSGNTSLVKNCLRIIGNIVIVDDK